MRSHAVITFVALSTLAGAADNVSWPQFRGPNSTGIGVGKPPVSFGPEQNVLWKAPVGAGLSSPIIWQGRIYLTEFNAQSKQFSTLCLDRATGKELWRRSVVADQVEKVHEISSPAGSTPVTD